MAKTYTLGALRLVIDTRDPHTPAMVYCGDRLSSTYDCAMGEGMVDAAYALTTSELQWLDQFADEVAAAYDVARKGNPDYA